MSGEERPPRGGLSEPPFTLAQLRYFVLAAEAASMTHAARAMLVSQSAVSTAIAQLEHHLGVQLLVRHHARGLSLTRAGEQFLRDARGLLAHAADLGDVGRGLGVSLTGQVTVGFFSPLAPFHLPRVIEQFAAVHPGVELTVVEGETEVLRRQLLQGACEAAVLYDFGLGEEIAAEVLAAAPPYLAVPATHRLARCEGVSLREAADEPMILLDLPYSREYFRSLAEQAGVDPIIRYRSTNYETVRALVARGFGYTILNQRPLADSTYDGGRVAAVPLFDCLPSLPIILASAQGVRLTKRALAFGDVCRQVFAAASPSAMQYAEK